MPRSSWARMVPELPRAPIRAPCAMALMASARETSLPPAVPAPSAVAAASCPANTASTAAAADSTVRYRFVPVSPSATG